jgi:broad specificity phosphatase PhoE
MKIRLLFLILLTLANPVFAEAQENYGPRNAVVLIIRHAEEPDQGSGLSAIGTARADAYANYFKNFRIDGQPLNLDYLFAAGDSSNSERPRLTIEPTGRALGLTVDSRFKNGRYLDLVDEIQRLPPGKNVLVSWHHGKIPYLLRAFGADPGRLLPRGKWPDDVYNWLIELRYDENGHLLASKRINEKLLSDD